MWSHSLNRPSTRSARRLRLREAVAKAVEERIEVVVVHDEQPPARMPLVVLLQVPGELQPHRRFARALLAEDDRRGRLRRIAIHLVPGGMIGALDAVLFEDRIGLRILLRKRIAGDAVMIEKLLDFHGCQFKVQGSKFKVRMQM